MNEDITLEDLGWQEIEHFGIIKKTYRKVDEMIENEEDLKEKIRNKEKIRFVYIDFIDMLGKGIDINMQDVEIKFEDEKIFVEKFGKISKTTRVNINLSLLELQAIHNKCEELGWLDE